MLPDGDPKTTGAWRGSTGRSNSGARKIDVQEFQACAIATVCDVMLPKSYAILRDVANSRAAL